MLTDNQVFFRLILSVVLSGFMGLERQYKHRTAGLRTHILVSLGSCLIMLTSLYVFDIYYKIAPLDPSRIAAGVITGIGFLGAGAILRDKERIMGLTTAASLWVVAGIGLAVGCGFIKAAICATALGLLVLFSLRSLEVRLFGKEDKPESQKGGG